MPRKIAAVVICLLIGGMVAGIFGYRSHVRKRDARYTTSCANHFIQLQLGLRIIANEDPDLILPSTDDTRAALLAINTDFNNPSGWLRNYGSACPESFLSDRSIGYVYVGDGLCLGAVTENSILILFCPGGNHHGFSDSSWGFARSWRYSNSELITELERAISRGESGEVAYSERAMKVLRSELNKRRQFVR